MHQFVSLILCVYPELVFLHIPPAAHHNTALCSHQLPFYTQYILATFFPQWVSGVKPRDRMTDQSAKQVDGLQQQLLVPHPGHAQRLQLLVGHAQQLLPVHLLLLEGGDVLLQAIVQTWERWATGEGDISAVLR